MAANAANKRLPLINTPTNFTLRSTSTYLTVHFIALLAHTCASAMRWLRIAARSASRLHGDAAGLRARRKRRPIRPAAIHRAVRDTRAHALADKAAVARRRIVAFTRTTQTAIVMARLGDAFVVRMLRAVVPLTPSRPSAVHRSRQQRAIGGILKPICKSEHAKW